MWVHPMFNAEIFVPQMNLLEACPPSVSTSPITKVLVSDQMHRQGIAIVESGFLRLQ